MTKALLQPTAGLTDVHKNRLPGFDSRRNASREPKRLRKHRNTGLENNKLPACMLTLDERVCRSIGIYKGKEPKSLLQLRGLTRQEVCSISKRSQSSLTK